MKNLRIIHITGVLALIGLVAAIAAGLRAAPGTGRADGEDHETGPAEAFHGFVLDPPQPAPDFTLTDQAQNPFRLSDQKGSVVVLFFGYTACPDVCPATLARYARVKRELGPLADQVRFAFITVDPDRDTPARLREYLGRLDPDFHGLWGTEEEVRRIVDAYGVYVEVVEAPASPVGYWINHTALSYIVDRNGNLRLAHPFGLDPEDMAADLRRLLLEEEGT